MSDTNEVLATFHDGGVVVDMTEDLIDSWFFNLDRAVKVAIYELEMGDAVTFAGERRLVCTPSFLPNGDLSAFLRAVDRRIGHASQVLHLLNEGASAERTELTTNGVDVQATGFRDEPLAKRTILASLRHPLDDGKPLRVGELPHAAMLPATAVDAVEVSS